MPSIHGASVLVCQFLLLGQFIETSTRKTFPLVSVSTGFTCLLYLQNDMHMNQKRKEEFLSRPKFSGYRQKRVKVTGMNHPRKRNTRKRESGAGAGIMEADDRPVTTVFIVQPSFHHRHSKTEYHKALPSSANVQSHLTSSFSDDGNAS